MDRRTFLRAGGAVGAAAALGPSLAACAPVPGGGSGGAEYVPRRLPTGSVLDAPARSARSTTSWW